MKTTKKTTKTNTPKNIEQPKPEKVKADQSTQPEEKKVYFKRVEMKKINSNIETTREILETRARGLKLDFTTATILLMLNSVKAEINRLNNCKYADFVNSGFEFSLSIAEIVKAKKKITFKQFVALFNILYALSKCRNEEGNFSHPANNDEDLPF